MALSIKDPETEQLARELARRTGETITAATKRALSEQLKRTKNPAVAQQLLFEKLEEISKRMGSRSRLDTRTPEEIIGYDENGLPR
jgi:antitoxin VapB